MRIRKPPPPDEREGQLPLFRRIRAVVLAPGHRGGATYEAAEDYARLNRQASDVFRFMLASGWRSLAEISKATGHPPASVSARLRDFRKPQYGGHVVERARLAGGLFVYRLVVSDESPLLEASSRLGDDGADERLR